MELNSRRNQLVAVNRLPHEILLNIFLFSGPNCPTMKERMWQYLYLTWVCRHWRDLALDYVELWSSIDISCPQRRIEEILARCKEAKLTIFHSDHFNRGHIELFKELVAPLVYRIGKMELCLSHKAWKEILPSLQIPAPSLRHFILTHNPRDLNNGYGSSAEEQSPWSLYDLFAGKAPLQTLTCQVVVLSPWHCLVPHPFDFRDLTLWLHAVPVEVMEQLLQLLKSCPALEYLDLKMGTVSSVSTSSDSPITMFRLVKLTLTDIGSTHIVRHLVTPHLRQCFFPWFGSGRQPLPPTLPEFLAEHLDLGELQELSVDGAQLDFFGSRISSEVPDSPSCMAIDSKPLDDQRQPVIRLNCSVHQLWSHAEELFLFLMKWSNLRKLVLSGNQTNSFSKKILKRALGIQELVFVGENSLLDSLKLLEDSTICPKIATLSYMECGSSERTVWTQPYRDQLIALGESRRRASAPLRKVQMSNCLPMATSLKKKLEELEIELIEKDMVIPV